MIENDEQLATSEEWVARMLRQRDDALTEPHWNEELRQDVADGIDAQRRKIEREIAEYLAKTQTTAPEPVPAGAAQTR